MFFDIMLYLGFSSWRKYLTNASASRRIFFLDFSCSDTTGGFGVIILCNINFLAQARINFPGGIT